MSAIWDFVCIYFNLFIKFISTDWIYELSLYNSFFTECEFDDDYYNISTDNWSFLYLQLFVSCNFFLLFATVLIGLIFYYGAKVFGFQLFRNNDLIIILRIGLLCALLVSFVFHILAFWEYCILFVQMAKYTIYDEFLFTPSFEINFDLDFFNFLNDRVVMFELSQFIGNFFVNFLSKMSFTFDFFGFIILTLAYIVGFFSLIALDTRLYWKNIRYIFSFNMFILVVFLYTTVSNLLLFFLMYECLLIPSFLIVYFVSPSRRAVQASLYFIIWTQIGSFLVLIAVSYMLTVSGGYDFFSLRNFNFTPFETWGLFFLIFFGFGFKVPIWPFHYWLTKTHVEAPAGFSMYLSGFLVKSAIYGFYKFSNVFGGEIDTFIFGSVALIGVIDASLKMWGQTDLKKLVAYGTIQEMNLIYLVFCWGDTQAIVGGIMFCFMHAILSTLMFFLVDCVQRRFHSRSVVEISGILHISPNLGISILLMCIFYSGVPGTLKFVSEFYIFSGLFEVSPILCVILMLIANVFGLIGFSKAWFNVVFGMNTKIEKYLPMDLTYKELFIILSCFSLLIASIFFFGYY